MNVIATDMINHKADSKKLNDTLNSPKYEPTSQENREFMMTQLIHFSDISNGTKPFPIYKKWVDKLFVEFFEQGDKEKELGLPITILCDREKTIIPDSQIFFINFITLDLTKTLVKAYPKFQNLVDMLNDNKKLWEEKKGKPYEIVDDD
jgi:hypothetical protein